MRLLYTFNNEVSRENKQKAASKSSSFRAKAKKRFKIEQFWSKMEIKGDFAMLYEFSVDPKVLLVIVAGLLALVLDYFPGVAKWFDALDTVQKRQVNAAAILIVLAVIFAGQCFSIFSTNLACTALGAIDALYIAFLAFGVNQGTHSTFKPSAETKARMFGKPTKPTARK